MNERLAVGKLASELTVIPLTEAQVIPCYSEQTWDSFGVECSTSPA